MIRELSDSAGRWQIFPWDFKEDKGKKNPAELLELNVNALFS